MIAIELKKVMKKHGKVVVENIRYITVKMNI